MDIRLYSLIVKIVCIDLIRGYGVNIRVGCGAVA